MAARRPNGNGYSARRRTGRQLQRRRHDGGGKGFPFWLKALIGAGVLGLFALFVLFAVAISVYRSYAEDLVAPDELAINQPSYGAKIFDRNGRLLYEYVDDRSGLRRPIKLESVSEAFLAATIATEDDSFFTNPGVNIRGLARAAWENLSPLSDTPGVLEGSGGSSITQQLVKNVYIPEEERRKRSISRKLRETVFAIELTQRYSKELILEWYVNQISYGGVYNGIEAASQGYFGKPAKDLTLAESALLAGIPQSPAAYDPVNHPEAATERRNQILDILASRGRVQIGEEKYFPVSNEDIEAARQEPVAIAEKRFPIDAPHFVLQYVQPQLEQLLGREALLRDGLIVTTTLDLELQHEANAILERWIREFENISNSRNGAVVVIDPKTGEILTMIGSLDYFREDIQGKNNNATALNSPGSAFKPFVYLTSFLTLGWGPGTLILDTPVSYKQSDGRVFTPTNPGRNFQGPISVRNALGNSLNIPAIKTADQTGVGNVVAQAKKMGFTSLTGGYGPAIATGGVDLTPIDMAFGYSVLANGGIMRGQEAIIPHRADERKIDPVSILKVTDAGGRVRYDIETKRKEERVVKEEYVYLVSSILSDPSSQCITFGCGGISVPGRSVSVKTGTSEPFDPDGPNRGKIGDTWAFGYTPDIVVAIWAGNSDNSPIVNIFSTSISFRAMRDVLLRAYQGRATTPLVRPGGLVEESVCVPSGLKPTPLCGRTVRDLFVRESLPTKDDDWWQRVQIDRRNGLRAAPGTPSLFVEEQVMLVPPPALMATEDDKKRVQDWAGALGLPLAPTEVSTLPFNAAGPPGSDLPAIIYSPSAGSSISGTVQVVGRASTDQLSLYRLEYGAGPAPSSWTIISQQAARVETGVLGVWDVSRLPQGLYTLRLTVIDRQRGQLSATVSVSIGPPTGPTPRPVGTPIAAP